ncbi:hypothetical protein B0T12DRAFT_471838 [Alternaria alternata]|nr:hypothetical protein B0T12DRAFT_471838 [Alternaria alternata]
MPPLSNEAIIAIVTLFVACPPSFILIWHLFRRYRSRSLRQDGVEIASHSTTNSTTSTMNNMMGSTTHPTAHPTPHTRIIATVNQLFMGNVNITLPCPNGACPPM